MGCIVYDRPGGTRTPLTLAEPIGEGGEGAVYVGRPNGGKEIAVKIFNPRRLEKSRDFLAGKIAAMVEIGQADNKKLIRHEGVAWPQMAVYGNDGDFVGYAMKRAKGKTLSRLAHPMLYKDHFKDLDRVKLAHMLIKLLSSADYLHRRYIRIGDINLNNVLCDDDYNPCWIDVDSYQIGVGDEGDGPVAPERINLRLTTQENREENAKMMPNKIWRCPVGRPEMTPPEHLDQEYSEITRTYAGDLFSMAILMFQCMMLGRHPYDAIKGGSPVANLRKGHFPYGEQGIRPGTTGGIPAGPWYKMWSHYTFKIKKLYALALREGVKDPSKRPALSEWISALKEYAGILDSPTAHGKHSREMRPVAEKEQGLPHRGTQEKS